MKPFESMGIKFDGEMLWVLDQRNIPHSEEWLQSPDARSMVSHIKSLSVRGAPLIGVAAAAQLGFLKQKGCEREEYLEALESLRASRPTAVNLMWAMDAMRECFDQAEDVAFKIFEEDQNLCSRIGEVGNSLINDGDNILTHCNTGGLATAGTGTALSIIETAHRAGKKIHIYVDETRPLLQGGRLTTWELKKLGIPYTVICDNMAGALMKEKKIDKVILGADRICLNGDFANKTGTYSLAVLAKYHEIPFYTAAPYTTVDLSLSDGSGIPIEQREAKEVLGVSGSFGEVIWSPSDATVHNPSFDVTPGSLLSGIVFDNGFVNQTEISNGELRNKLN